MKISDLEKMLDISHKVLRRQLIKLVDYGTSSVVRVGNNIRVLDFNQMVKDLNNMENSNKEERLCKTTQKLSRKGANTTILTFPTKAHEYEKALERILFKKP